MEGHKAVRQQASRSARRGGRRRRPANAPPPMDWTLEQRTATLQWAGHHFY